MKLLVVYFLPYGYGSSRGSSSLRMKVARWIFLKARLRPKVGPTATHDHTDSSIVPRTPRVRSCPPICRQSSQAQSLLSSARNPVVPVLVFGCKGKAKALVIVLALTEAHCFLSDSYGCSLASVASMLRNQEKKEPFFIDSFLWVMLKVDLELVGSLGIEGKEASG